MQAQSQLNGVAPDGQQVVLSSKTSEVAQRQHDGRWRFLIDNPNAGQ
jgi:ketosteroid isomerase-like protein